MNAGKTVFAQIMEHLPRYEFDKCVQKHKGNHRLRKFPCYDQFLCLAYAKLTYRKSLRDFCIDSDSQIKFLPNLDFLLKKDSSNRMPGNGHVDEFIILSFTFQTYFCKPDSPRFSSSARQNLSL